MTNSILIDKYCSGSVVVLQLHVGEITLWSTVCCHRCCCFLVSHLEMRTPIFLPSACARHIFLRCHEDQLKNEPPIRFKCVACFSNVSNSTIGLRVPPDCPSQYDHRLRKHGCYVRSFVRSPLASTGQREISPKIAPNATMSANYGPVVVVACSRHANRPPMYLV